MDKSNINNLPGEKRTTGTVTLGIAGMTCEGCAQKVERALRGLDGVKDVAVNQPGAMATVTYDNSAVDVPAMHDALLKSGYKSVAAPQR
jgi:copper chaperone CopZ